MHRNHSGDFLREITTAFRRVVDVRWELRFWLGEGVSTQIVFSATDLITRDGEDAVVRLIDSTGDLVDQFAHLGVVGRWARQF